MRSFLIAGNWKMNQNAEETKAYFSALSKLTKEAPEGVKLLLCPVFTSLRAAVDAGSGIKGLHIGAQNMHFEDKGAFTGEITAAMIKETGADHVIIGHSERREYFNETDETVNKKTKKALAAGLVPVVCVGELLSERKKEIQNDVVGRQVKTALDGISSADVESVVIAYEPVWAIGTGETATPEQAQEMHAFIRSEVKKHYNADVAAGMQILYGGSMNPGNAGELLSCEDVDGGLIGGASLKPDSYFEIIQTPGKTYKG